VWQRMCIRWVGEGEHVSMRGSVSGHRLAGHPPAKVQPKRVTHTPYPTCVYASVLYKSENVTNVWLPVTYRIYKTLFRAHGGKSVGGFRLMHVNIKQVTVLQVVVRGTGKWVDLIAIKLHAHVRRGHMDRHRDRTEQHV
jgi:hypothetical protein